MFVLNQLRTAAVRGPVQPVVFLRSPPDESDSSEFHRGGIVRLNDSRHTARDQTPAPEDQKQDMITPSRL